MKKNNNADDQTEETAADNQHSGKPAGFENIKNLIADKLHDAADAIGEKAAEAASQDGQSNKAQYEKQASEWLGHSARYIRQFDCKQADARLRECVRQNPGRSILIAGGIGLVIGAILRRR